MSYVSIDGLSNNELVTVVELQRLELNRLLGEQRRLNDRIDKLLHMQEREQVLRQQMQAALERLAEQNSLPDKPTAQQPPLAHCYSSSPTARIAQHRAARAPPEGRRGTSLPWHTQNYLQVLACQQGARERFRITCWTWYACHRRRYLETCRL